MSTQLSLGRLVPGAAILLVLLCGACMLAAQTTSTTDRLQVTVIRRQSATGSMPIAAGVGDQFSIRIPANHTTGFQWTLANRPNPAVVQFVSTRYEEPQGGRVGQGGVEVWTFNAIGRGKTSILLSYRRTFEKNVPPAKKQSFSVVVS